MRPFSMMSSMLWGIVGTWMLFLFFGFMLLETFAVIAKQNRNRFFNPLILLLLYSMLQSVLWLTPMEEPAETLPLPVRSFVGLPYVVILLLCMLLTGLLICFTRQCRSWQKENITNMSVKYAIDTFPEGICCYDENGMILLKNRMMERFGRMITGESLTNGMYLYERLCRGELLPECRVQTAEDGQLLVTAAGKAFSVTKKPLEHGAKDLHFLIAADITEEYHKTEELLLRQKQVQKLNEQLRGYNQEISAVITARETLSARVKIHDELGLSLLAAKRYILAGGSEEEKQTIIATLRQQLRYLRDEQAEAEIDEYSQLLRAAGDLGIEIIRNGDFPADASLRHTFVTAIHECLTNTIRHAHGDKVSVEVCETETAYREQIRNNGDRPAGPIVEKGGLAALREMVLAQGGSMEVKGEDEFILEITLPKEEMDEI